MSQAIKFSVAFGAGTMPSAFGLRWPERARSFVRRHHHSRSERRNPFASNDERPTRGGSRGARVRAEQIPETQPTVRAFGPDIHVAIFIQLRVHQETNERGIIFEQQQRY